MIQVPKMPMAEIRKRIDTSPLKDTVYGALVGLPANPSGDCARMKEAGLSDSACGFLIELADAIGVLVSNWSEIPDPEDMYEVSVITAYKVHVVVAIKDQSRVASALRAVTGLTKPVVFEKNMQECHVALVMPEFEDQCVLTDRQVAVVSSLPLEDQGSLVSALEVALKDAMTYASEHAVQLAKKS